MSRAQDFEGLLQRMKLAEATLHKAAKDLAEFRVGIEMKAGKVVLQ